MSRGGTALDLSSDHKPSRPSERARILAAGGTIIKDRVHGVLAVSRAFGDAEHKRGRGEVWGQALSADPVSAEPEVTLEPLTPADEFVVIACDGVYDVMSSQEVRTREKVEQEDEEAWPRLPTATCIHFRLPLPPPPLPFARSSTLCGGACCATATRAVPRASSPRRPSTWAPSTT